MTDYELITFFYEGVNSLQVAFMNYVAVLFAFLIAAYLVAARLESSMVFIIVGLFTLVILQQSVTLVGFGYDVAALLSQIAARASEDPTGVGWHGGATPLAGAVGAPVLRFSGAVIMIFSYIGGLVFFFHQRHVGRAQ